MSYLTECNFCVLNQIKRKNKGKKVTTVNDGNWIVVMIDGEKAGVTFMALGTHCEC